MKQDQFDKLIFNILRLEVCTDVETSLATLHGAASTLVSMFNPCSTPSRGAVIETLQFTLQQVIVQAHLLDIPLSAPTSHTSLPNRWSATSLHEVPRTASLYLGIPATASDRLPADQVPKLLNDSIQALYNLSKIIQCPFTYKEASVD